MNLLSVILADKTKILRTLLRVPAPKSSYKPWGKAPHLARSHLGSQIMSKHVKIMGVLNAKWYHTDARAQQKIPKVFFSAHEVFFEEFTRLGFPNYVTHRAKP